MDERIRIRWLMFLLGLTTALMIGCVPSVNPIYTSEDVVFDAALVGIYADPRYKENFTIVEQWGDPCCYRIIQKEGYAEYRMIGRLVKLGEQRFMDLTPEEPLQVDAPGVIGGTDLLRSLTWAPLHAFVKVTPEGSGFKLAMMNERALAALVKKDPNALKLIRGNLIVSSTKELQEFLKRYGNDKDVFNQETFLTNRVRALPQSTDPQDRTRLISVGFFTPSTNGEPAEIDLRTTSIAWPGQGDLIVQFWIGPKGPKPAERFDWKYRITVPRGGLIEFTNRLEINAPESGYQPFAEVNMPASLGSKWQSVVWRNYFVRLRNGNYARIELSFQPGQEKQLRIATLVNTSGARLLDAGYRPEKVFD